MNRWLDGLPKAELAEMIGLAHDNGWDCGVANCEHCVEHVDEPQKECADCIARLAILNEEE
jgi:hypothetical protein